MKIAIFTDSFYPMKNGIVTALLNMIEPLADHGYRVWIFTPSMGKIEEYSYPGIRVIRIPSIPAGFYEDFRWPSLFHYPSYRILKKEKIQLIHFMTPFFTSYLGIKFARLLNIPVIGTFHTFIADPQYIGHLFRGVVQTQVETVWHYTLRYYNAADVITTPSPSTLASLQELGCTVPHKIISNGIDTGIFDNSGWETFKRQYQIKEKALLYVGRVSKEKNMKGLLEGFIQAWQRERELQLVIIGDGPSMGELRQICKQKGLGKGVIFVGALPYEKLVKSGVYRACKVFITASVTENQPMTILEAQANGMVCIGPRARGIPDLIQDGVTGRLYEPNDSLSFAQAILDVIHHPRKLHSYQKNTLKSIKVHGLQEVIEQWREFYPRVLADYRKGKFPKKEHIRFGKFLAYIKTFTWEWNRLYLKKTPNQGLGANL